MPLIQCHQLNPCFPHRVVRLMSMRDRRLYVFFHICLWSGVLSFAVGTGLYAAMRTYAFFIMALPCVCIMFVGQFGFRWLAMKNEDKFEVFYPSAETGENGSVLQPDSAFMPAPPPPPAYSATYSGPIFTIDGTLAPPPEYTESDPTGQPKYESQHDGGSGDCGSSAAGGGQQSPTG